jgi:DNA-binding CsgD family transcriptional regulator
MGDYYIRNNMPDSAVYYTMKAFKNGIRENLKEVIKNSAAQLEQIYNSKKVPDSTYKYAKIHYQYKDSLESEKTNARFSQLELQYQFETSRKEETLKQQKKDIVIALIIFVIVSILIITFLFLSRQIVKTKNVRLEKQHLSDDLDFKNKELTISVMNLLKKNEFLVEHTQRLIEIQQRATEEKIKSDILYLIHSLERDAGATIWEEFELRFSQVHSGFYERLLKSYSDLSANELKLCALLRLNLSTKEICELTGQRPASLDVARSRLRKKLGITDSQTNLISFLTQI